MSGKIKVGQADRRFSHHHRHVHDSAQEPSSSLPAWASEPAHGSFLYAELPLGSHHVPPQILLGGAALIGGIFAGTWSYMSTKQARKASREPGERGALPSC